MACINQTGSWYFPKHIPSHTQVVDSSDVGDPAAVKSQSSMPK